MIVSKTWPLGSEHGSVRPFCRPPALRQRGLLQNLYEE
jgi:hypothetical protein